MRVIIGYVECASEDVCMQCARVAKLHTAVAQREFPAYVVDALANAAKSGIYSIPKRGRDLFFKDVFDEAGRLAARMDCISIYNWY
jgi:hypothetical protein